MPLPRTPGKGPSFDVSLAAGSLISAIVQRAFYLGLVKDKNRLTHLMDLTACHANGCPLQLDRMFHCDPEDLAHDLLGINKHIDQSTGKLTDLFLPRFAVNDSYLEALRSFDWGFTFSEDRHRRQDARAELAALHEQQALHDPDGLVWSEHIAGLHGAPLPVVSKDAA